MNSMQAAAKARVRAGGGVEQRKAQARQQSKPGVGKAQVQPDRRHQDRQDLAIDEVDHIDQHQHAEGVIGVAARHAPRAFSLGCCGGRHRPAPRLSCR
jgi:hypothetical protein